MMTRKTFATYGRGTRHMYFEPIRLLCSQLHAEERLNQVTEAVPQLRREHLLPPILSGNHERRRHREGKGEGEGEASNRR